MTRRILIAIFLISISGASVFAQSPPTVEALIDQSIANAEQNAAAALAFTFHENYVGSTTTLIPQARPSTTARLSLVLPTVDSNMNGDSESSVQYDVLFIKGVPYRRVISVNHRPLSPEAAVAESKRYDAAVAAIYAMSDEQRLKMTKGSNSLMVDPRLLTSFYNCNITGHEKVHKRPATVVDCKLRHDVTGQSGDTTGPVGTDIKLWIDDQQPFFVRTRAILNRAIDNDRKLTQLTIQWKMVDGVWHQTSTEVDWVGPEGSGTKGKVVDTFSDFKQFRTEFKILPEYTSDIPLPLQP